MINLCILVLFLDHLPELILAMLEHEKIDYLEFPSKDLTISKRFFNHVFNWQFKDFGEEYCSFTGAGVMGGFHLNGLTCKTRNGSVLTVFYSDDIKETEQKIIEAEGDIVVEVFAFPGGVRFHFEDPNGNEYAVWSDKVDGKKIDLFS